MPSSGVWNTMKVAVWPRLHLIDQVVLHHHLGDASRREAAHEPGPADIGLVDLEPEPGRQQHTKRRDHPQEPALAVGSLEHDDHKGDVGPVLGCHVLDDGALLASSRLPASRSASASRRRCS